MSGIHYTEGFAPLAWTRMPRGAATTIAAEAGRMWKRSQTGSMAPSCRAPVSVVFEAVYSSFGSCREAPGSPWCASVISGRARRQPRQSGMLESMSAIARAIDGKGMELDTVEAASRFLWAAQAHGSPYIASYGRPPPSPRAPTPLSTLPLVWRAASIEAMAELAGLVDCRTGGTVPLFLYEAFRTFRGREGQQARRKNWRPRLRLKALS